MQPSQTPTPLCFLSVKDYEQPALTEHLETLLQPLGGMANVVKPGDRVLLKPNLLTGANPTGECTTRPEVVAAVAKLVQVAGGHPFLGDSPAFGTALGVAKANGYQPFLEELGIPVVEFSSQRYATASDEFNHLRLSREALDADVVINLPKVKSHVQLTMTLGVKNLFGCVPGKMKAWWHMEAGKDQHRFGTMLVETARAIAPQLTIMDGIIAHEGNGPSQGNPRQLGILAASTDVFALDRAMLDILQIDPQTVPTVAAAQRLGICPHLNSVTYPLNTPQDFQITDWQLPERLMPIDFGAPRVVRSLFKHLYIRFIQEPMATYSR